MSRILIPPNLPAQNRVVSPDENGDVLIRPRLVFQSIEPPPGDDYKMPIVESNGAHLQNDFATWQSGDSDQFIFNMWFSYQPNTATHNWFGFGVGNTAGGHRHALNYSAAGDSPRTVQQLGEFTATDIINGQSVEFGDRNGIQHILCARSGTTLQYWLNGEEFPFTTAPTAAAMPYGTMARLRYCLGWFSAARGAFYGDFWYYSGQYLDLDIEANRRLFTEENGAPVNLGDNGEDPLGTPPDIFFSGPAVEWNAGENKGMGGDFVLFNGPFTDFDY